MKILTLSLLIVLISSCGKSGEGGGSSTAKVSDVPISKIIGMYNLNQIQNKCTNESGNSYLTIVEINQEAVTIDVFGFAAEDCFSIPSMKKTLFYDLEKTDKDKFELGLIWQYITMLTDAQVTESNTNEYCGFNNWTKNVMKTVTDTECEEDTSEYGEWTDFRFKDEVATYKNSDGEEVKLYPFKEKIIFSKWKDFESDQVITDFSGNDYEETFNATFKIELTQVWIDVLNTASRDTTGLTAGDIIECEYDVIITSVGEGNDGLSEVGTISFVSDDSIDSPINNACLQLDTEMNEEDHVYFTMGDRLFIDYVGSADDGDFGYGLLN